MHATALPLQPDYRFEYSICTIVSDAARYGRMVEAFRRQGFGPADCEFLFVDNTRCNQLDSYAGGNRLLSAAQGRYVVLCHQDVVPQFDDRRHLDRLLAELTALDPAWAVCGNAGVTASGEKVERITDPHGRDRTVGQPFPRAVASLDENLLVIRAEANLAFSRDLSGFHWYGSDICVVADVLGWRSYVIAFHLLHESEGRVDEAYEAGKRAFQRKYARAFRPRWHSVVMGHSFILASDSDASLPGRMLRKAGRVVRALARAP